MHGILCMAKHAMMDTEVPQITLFLIYEQKSA